MHLLKTVGVLWFSFALILSQAVFSVAAFGAAPEKKQCCGCGCEQMACCAAPATPAPPSAPLLPVRSFVPSQVQLIAVTFSNLLPTPELRREKARALPFAFVSFSAVPLYARNCCYLL